TLVMAPEEGHRDPGVVVDAIRAHEVTIVQLVPSLLELMLASSGWQECRSLRLVCCAGEVLPQRLCARLTQGLPGVELVNTYGPTECSIDVTAWHYRPDAARIAIGTPLPNMRVYVVDPAGQLVPIGVTGELRVSGVGVAQ